MKVFVCVFLLVVGVAVAQSTDTTNVGFFVKHEADLYAGELDMYFIDGVLGLRFNQATVDGFPIGWDWDQHNNNDCGEMPEFVCPSQLPPGCYYPVGVSETFDVVLPTTCSRDVDAPMGLRCTGTAEEQAKSALPVNSEEYKRALNVGVDKFPFLINHLVLDWNPCGHPPLGVYMYPHTDWHWYTITPGERNEIVCSFFPPCPLDDVSSAMWGTPPIYPGAVPPNYGIVPEFMVPDMGIHSVDFLDPQLTIFAGTPWEGEVLLYGYFNGTLAFFETMFSHYLFLNQISVDVEGRQPSQLPVEGQYPRRFGMRVYTDGDETYYDGFLRDFYFAYEGEDLEQALQRDKLIRGREEQVDYYNENISSSSASALAPIAAVAVLTVFALL